MSPFAAISATMGWETFFMVQMLWLGAADLPARAPEKDWDLQASPQALCCPQRPYAELLAMYMPCTSCLLDVS